MGAPLASVAVVARTISKLWNKPILGKVDDRNILRGSLLDFSKLKYRRINMYTSIFLKF